MAVLVLAVCGAAPASPACCLLAPGAGETGQALRPVKAQGSSCFPACFLAERLGSGSRKPSASDGAEPSPMQPVAAALAKASGCQGPQLSRGHPSPGPTETSCCPLPSGLGGLACDKPNGPSSWLRHLIGPMGTSGGRLACLAEGGAALGWGALIPIGGSECRCRGGRPGLRPSGEALGWIPREVPGTVLAGGRRGERGLFPQGGFGSPVAQHLPARQAKAWGAALLGL